MISEAEMDELAEQAIERFPIPEEVLMIVQFTGNRTPVLEAVRTRVLWMLNAAYTRGMQEAGK